MSYPKDNLRRKVKDTNRINSPVGWTLGAVFLVAVLGLLFLYDGSKDATGPSGANSPNVVAGSSSASGSNR
jgi:hypothetical protein